AKVPYFDRETLTLKDDFVAESVPPYLVGAAAHQHGKDVACREFGVNFHFTRATAGFRDAAMPSTASRGKFHAECMRGDGTPVGHLVRNASCRAMRFHVPFGDGRAS